MMTWLNNKWLNKSFVKYLNELINKIKNEKRFVGGGKTKKKGKTKKGDKKQKLE